VAEYGSPHGGSCLGLLTDRGLRVAEADENADVVVDCFGLMHEADQAAALASRVARLRPGGLLLVQFHSLATIVRGGQWNALRHAHYAYYSAPTLIAMLARVGLTARTAFTFPLYGGTVALALTRGEASDETVAAFAAEELTAGVLRPEVVGELQQTALDAATRLASWVAQERAAGRRVLGYSAASRSVALLCGAGLTAGLLPGIADAAPAKQGRRLPGSGILVIAPAELVAARPDVVLVFVPDLLPGVRRCLPQIEASGGCWVPVDGPASM
jgi:C-methyltransferase C-terminal domain